MQPKVRQVRQTGYTRGRRGGAGPFTYVGNPDG